MNNKGVLVSFSLYGDGLRYNGGALRNALNIAKVYPGGKMVVYMSPGARNRVKEILMRCKHVEVRPSMPTEGASGMLSRFRPAFAQEAEIVVVADIDAWVNTRRKDLMEEWLASDKDFHICRLFNRKIPGGLWAVRNNALEGAPEPDYNGYINYDGDQAFLARKVYPVVAPKVYAHCRQDVMFDTDGFNKPLETWQIEGDLQHVGYWSEKVFDRTAGELEEFLEGNARPKKTVKDFDGIMSFSVYGKDARYNAGILRNVLLFEELYPGWKMVIYLAPGVREDLFDILPLFDFVEVREEEASKGHSGMLWRLRPLLDKEAEVVLVRDADTLLNKYFVELEEEWLNTDYPLHSVQHNSGKVISCSFLGAKTAGLEDVLHPSYLAPRNRGADESWAYEGLYKTNYFKLMVHTYIGNAPRVGYYIQKDYADDFLKYHNKNHCSEEDYVIYRHEALAYLRRQGKDVKNADN